MGRLPWRPDQASDRTEDRRSYTTTRGTAALKDPRVVERFADLGTDPVPQERATPAALGQHLQAEIVKWKPIIQAAGEYAD